MILRCVIVVVVPLAVVVVVVVPLLPHALRIRTKIMPVAKSHRLREFICLLLSWMVTCMTKYCRQQITHRSGGIPATVTNAVAFLQLLCHFLLLLALLLSRNLDKLAALQQW